MVEYYKDNPNVTVIVDRRDGPDRRSRPATGRVQGAARDPRPPPARVEGTFPDTDPHGPAPVDV